MKRIEKIVGKENVYSDKAHLISYSYDSSLEFGMPELVVFPRHTEEISRLIKLFNKENIPFVTRGSGTGYSGGSVPTRGGAIIVLTRMNKIIEVDYENKNVTVEPGVINDDINKIINKKGFRYIPDPASRNICTIGGNISENAGGPYCLAYGVTQKYVEEIEVVLPDGDIAIFGNEKNLSQPSLMNLIIGSEGTLGVITKARLKISEKPEKALTIKVTFDENIDAARCVKEIISEGVICAALEMIMGAVISSEEKDTGILLICLEGKNIAVEKNIAIVKNICHRNRGVIEKVHRELHDERGFLLNKKIEQVHKKTRKNKRYLVDGVVPRENLPSAIDKIKKLSLKHNLPVVNTFHAGDGNIHPCIFYEIGKDKELQKVKSFMNDIIKMCVNLGGTLTGEHGIGSEKIKHMEMVFGENERNAMKNIKSIFDKKGLCNPDKAI